MNQADVHLCKDPLLAPIVRKFSLTPLKRRREPFPHLVCSILSQQLSTHVADKIIERFELACKNDISAKTILSLSTETLRGSGLSRQKQSYVHNIANHYLENQTFWNQIQSKDDVQIQTELCSIKGVGTWTVQMLLIFNLQRPDILPIGDLAIRDAICKLYAITDTGRSLHKKIDSLGHKWSPYRSRASRYFWKWRDNNRSQ